MLGELKEATLAHGPKSKKRRAFNMRAAKHAAQLIGYAGARALVAHVESRLNGAVYPPEIGPYLLAVKAGL